MQATRILPREVLHPLIRLKPFLLFILHNLEHPIVCHPFNRDFFKTKNGQITIAVAALLGLGVAAWYLSEDEDLDKMSKSLDEKKYPLKALESLVHEINVETAIILCDKLNIIRKRMEKFAIDDDDKGHQDFMVNLHEKYLKEKDIIWN